MGVLLAFSSTTVKQCQYLHHFLGEKLKVCVCLHTYVAAQRCSAAAMSVVEEKVKCALLKWQEIHPHVGLCFLFGTIKGILVPLDFKPPSLRPFCIT